MMEDDAMADEKDIVNLMLVERQIDGIRRSLERLGVRPSAHFFLEQLRTERMIHEIVTQLESDSV